MNSIEYGGENVYEIGHWINLSKIHKASPYTSSKRPQDWRRSSSVKSLIKVIANAYKLPEEDVIASRQGNRTIAHYNLALAYAAYLDLETYQWLLNVVEDQGWPLLINDGLIPKASKVVQEEPWTEAIAQFWDEFFVSKGKPIEVKTKVKNAVGVADIVLKAHVVEVKRYCDWKAAMGQAMAYAHVMELQPAIALFDAPIGADMTLPLSVCTAHEVVCHIFLGERPGHFSDGLFVDNLAEINLKLVVEISRMG